MKRKPLGMVGFILLAFVMSLIIGINIYSYSARMLNRDALPMPFGINVSVVLSGSMEPEFAAGDMIVVTKAEEYALRDIVVFQEGNRAVVHRIVAIDGDTVTTRGDANGENDEPIALSRIKGRVVFSVPYLGYVVLFFKSTIGTLLVLALAFFLFQHSYVREKRARQKKLAEIRAEIDALKQDIETQ